MYIKSINQILKANAPLKIKLFDGNVINGKVLTNENGKGTIKLYDGTIIPAIFVSENDVDKDKYVKFVVQSFDGENFVLKILDENADAKNEKSLSTIISDLNIPFEEGKDIILSLIRYNLPATNGNINSIYKNLSFINNIKNMSDSEIIFFLNEHLGREIDINSKEFKLAKEIFTSLKDVDKNFLSFMLENDISHDIINILKTQDFMKNKFFLNSFIDNIKNSIGSINKNIENILSSTGESDIPNFENSGVINNILMKNISPKNESLLTNVPKSLAQDLEQANNSSPNSMDVQNKSNPTINSLPEDVRISSKLLNQAIGETPKDFATNIGENAGKESQREVNQFVERRKAMVLKLMDVVTKSLEGIDEALPSETPSDNTIKAQLNNMNKTLHEILTHLTSDEAFNSSENINDQFKGYDKLIKNNLMTIFKGLQGHDVKAALNNPDTNPVLKSSYFNVRTELSNLLTAINKNETDHLKTFMEQLKASPSNSEKVIIDALLKHLTKNMGIDSKNVVVSSFEEAVNLFKNNKELFSFSSSEAFNKLLDSLDTFKKINDSYSLYFFNLYENKNIFKNNIIIKNKYKGSKYIDVNDVKAFITVDTQNLGVVEGNLYKKNDDISISFNVNSEFVSLFKNHSRILKGTLKEFGYNIVNISVQELDKEITTLPFSDFFNESILKELDVIV